MQFIDLIKMGVNTLYFNFKVFGFFRGLKLQVIVGPKTKFGVLGRNSIIIHKPGFGRLRFGFCKGSFAKGESCQSYINIESNCIIEILDFVSMAQGIVFNVTNSSKVKITSLTANYGCLISIANGLIVDENVLLGWNVSIIDSDGHMIKSVDSNKKNVSRPIHIHKNCWLSAESTILKGVTLAEDTIIPYGNIITKSNDSPQSIWGGYPNHILKKECYRDDAD